MIQELPRQKLVLILSVVNQQHKLYLHDYMKLQYCKSFKIKLQLIPIINKDNKPINGQSSVINMIW